MGVKIILVMTLDLTRSEPHQSKIYATFLNDALYDFLLSKLASFTFRVFPFKPMDLGKTCVRIDEKHMQMLDVKSGDMVKISGCRTSGAICLPLDLESKQSHVDIIYHDESSKKIPLVQLSNIVSCNIRGGNVGELVVVSKAKAVRAERIVLGTNQTLFPYNKENLALDKLDGMVVSKGDRVDMPHSDSPQTTPFQVLDANPVGELYIIDKNTRIEFSEIPKEAMHMQIPQLNKLLDVIPVVKQIKSEIFTLTFPSIEIYDNGTKFIFYMHEKLSPNQQPFGMAMGRPNIKVWDDLGNSYVVLGYEGHGGHSDMSDFNYGMSGTLVPPLDSKAKELNFVIQEMFWQKIKNPSFVGSAENVGKEPETAFNYMTPAEMIIEIISGPWEFKIQLK